MKLQVLFLMLLSLGVTTMTQAEPLYVEYAKFYSHTRKLNAEDTQALQFAFGFMRVGTTTLCQVDKVRILTEKQILDIAVTPEQRFVLPSDNVLKLAEAMVEIDIASNANQCDLSVQLETKPEYLKSSYQASELQFIFKQYQAFFNAMGGMLSFMMPQVIGLQFQLPANTKLQPSAPDIELQGDNLNITPEWWKANATLGLSQPPLRIVAQTRR